jgi:hypothetical protein
MTEKEEKILQTLGFVQKERNSWVKSLTPAYLILYLDLDLNGFWHIMLEGEYVYYRNSNLILTDLLTAYNDAMILKL